MLDELVGVRKFRGLDNLRAMGFRAAIGDVLPDWCLEQKRLLQNKTNLLAKGGLYSELYEIQFRREDPQAADTPKTL